MPAKDLQTNIGQGKLFIRPIQKCLSVKSIATEGRNTIKEKCHICQKEFLLQDLRDHIESNHLFINGNIEEITASSDEDDDLPEVLISSRRTDSIAAQDTGTSSSGTETATNSTSSSNIIVSNDNENVYSHSHSEHSEITSNVGENASASVTTSNIIEEEESSNRSAFQISYDLVNDDNSQFFGKRGIRTP